MWRVTFHRPLIRLLIGFQSTPSVWRVTVKIFLLQVVKPISIHTLRVEGDVSSVSAVLRGGISIHTLRVEGDFSGGTNCPPPETISIHTLRVEGDTTLL